VLAGCGIAFGLATVAQLALGRHLDAAYGSRQEDSQ
jgi:hypothetical protein